MFTSHEGYYDVTVMTHAGLCVHRVLAASDYAAARKVREETGFMPARDRDVSLVRSKSGRSMTLGAVE